MAGFKTHITFSSILGAGYGTAAYFLYDVPIPSCLLAGGLCGVSGMLPDLDSGPGRPLHESMAFAAAVVPVMLIHYFQQLGLSHEMMIIIGAGLYLLIRFGGAWLLQHFTVHRGMFHSIPAAAIFGELGYLLASGDTNLRLYKAGAVVLGYMSHLFLDEVWSIEWSHGLQFKSSFGTALKIFGHGWWPNISAYAKLAVLTSVILIQPAWLQQYFQQSSNPTAVSNSSAGQTPKSTAHRIVWPWQ
jgi:LexA-binding, inner membrane-associated putative hydrolase